MRDWAQYVRQNLSVPRMQPEREAEMVEELAGQLEQAYGEALQRGMSREQAEAAAIQHVADWAALANDLAKSHRGKEAIMNTLQRRVEDRDAARRGRFSLFTEVQQDVRYALRVLGKSRGFTAVAVLTMALGIGANTAIFSLIDAVLLRSLPVRNSQELVLLQWKARKEPRAYGFSGYGDCVTAFRGPETPSCNFSKPFLEDVRSKTDVFSGIAAFASAGRLNVSGNGPASLARAQYVSGDFFPTLRLRPSAGRLLQPADDTPTAPAAAVLSHGYWMSAFGGDPGAVGRTIHLQGLPFTIVGVAESAFQGLSPGNTYDLWVPMSAEPQLQEHWTPAQDGAGNWWVVAVARLKPGVARKAAESAVSALFFNQMVHGEKPMSMAEESPAIQLAPAEMGLTGVRVRMSAPLYVLMLAVGIVLLIACANVAGLLLSRAAARQKEIAVRLALGAGRARIVRQLLTESVAISVAGGVSGIALAMWSARGLLAFLASSSSRPLGFTAEVDLRVLAFTAAASIGTGILFGLAPAFSLLRFDLTPALKDGPKQGPRGEGTRWWLNLRNALVVVQVALTVVVLVGAGLLVHTLENLKRVDPGFETTNILTFRVDPTLTQFKGEKLGGFYRELRDRFSELPGVDSASYSQGPLLSGGLSITGFRLHGQPEEKQQSADVLPVGPDFFRTMKIPLLGGRDFSPQEFAALAIAPGSHCSVSSISGTPRGAIVNQSFARTFFSNQNPIGQRFGGGRDPEDNDPEACADPGWEIVGLVSDARYENLRRDVHPTIYQPAGEGGAFELRTASDPRAAISSVREVLKRSGFDLPVYDVKTQTQQIEDLLFQERLIASLSSFFGLLALLLACIGLYGLLSFEVAGRTREIGIRMALGAREADVLRRVVLRGITLAGVGAALGLAASFGVTRFLGSMLFGVKPDDPFTLMAVATILMLVAFAACYGPARSATRVDPLIALRYE